MSMRSAAIAVMVMATAFAWDAGASNDQAASPGATGAMLPEQPPAGVDAIFGKWDVDRNGALSPQEFRNGWTILRRQSVIERRLQQQFRLVDRNHDDGIDKGEYTQLALVKAAGKTAPALSTFDANNDQRLNFAEYTDLVRQLSPKQQPPAAKSRPAVQGPQPVRK